MKMLEKTLVKTIGAQFLAASFFGRFTSIEGKIMFPQT